MFIGVEKNSILDYPGKMSYVVFFEKCLLACKYCHNRKHKDNELLWWTKIEEDIEANREFIDAVVFTGGEPLLYKNLNNWVKIIKKKNLLVGLHTSGVTSKHTKDTSNLILDFDWVGIDYKAPTKELFKQITGTDFFDQNISKIQQLAKNFRNFEVRTTFTSDLAIKDTFDSMQKFLVENHIYTWYIQKCYGYKDADIVTKMWPATNSEGQHTPANGFYAETKPFNLKDFLRLQKPILNIRIRTKAGEYSYDEYIK